MTNDYQAWLIDLDGTLYYQRWVRLAMAAELMLGHWRVVRGLKAFRIEHERLRREGCDGAESPYLLQLERAALHSGQARDQLEAAVTEWMIRRPGKWLRLFRRVSLLAEIEAFRRQGGRTAIVSDYPATAKLQALGIGSWFEVVVANGEQGGPKRLKPWPDGYLMAAEKLGVEPSGCIVLGDREDADGEAARRAGMAFRRIG